MFEIGQLRAIAREHIAISDNQPATDRRRDATVKTGIFVIVDDRVMATLRSPTS